MRRTSNLGRMGPYHLVHPLWSGSNTNVYLAKATMPGGVVQTVAVKYLRPEVALQGRLLRAFLREVQAAACVSHPNVVQVFDAGQARGVTYAAMEYFPGWRLAALVEQLRSGGIPFPWTAALGIVAQLADGADQVHRAFGPSGNRLDMVLRNIAPENVVVSDEGHAALLDFGSVARAGNSNRPRDLKALNFAAPEVVAGLEFDQTADVYSLGMILGSLIDPDLTLPRGIYEVVSTATHSNKQYRYRTARELRRAIDYLARETSLSIDEPSVASTLQRAVTLAACDGQPLTTACLAP